MRTYSYSKLDTYSKCPQAYKYKYEDKLRAPDTVPLILGTAIHAAIEQYLKHLIKVKRQTDITEFDRVTQEIKDALPEDVLEEFTDICERFQDSFMLSNPEMETYIEAEYAFDKDWNLVPWDSENAWFRAKIDLAQVDKENAIITDWKSNRVIPPQSAIDDSFQLDVYSLVMSLVFPKVQELDVNLYFARYSASRTSTRNLKDAVKTKAKIERMANKIETAKVFPAKVSSQCEYCEYKGLCTTFKSHLADLNIEDIATPADAQKLAKKTYLMEIALKEAKNKLKAYIDTNGPVEVEDEKIDYWPTETTSFPDSEGLVLHMISQGIPKTSIWANLKLSKTAVEKILKGKKDLQEEALAKFSKVVTSTRFEFRKITEE